MPSIAQFRTTGVAEMLLGTFCFSVGAVFIKLAGARLPAMEVVFARSVVMLVYCFVLARLAGADIPGHNKRLLLMRGVGGFGAYFCIFYAIIHMPLADATVITLSFPLLVPLWASMFLGERLVSATVMSIALGAAGMVCVTRPGFLFAEGADYPALAVAAGFGSMLLSSICLVMVRKLTETDHPLVIVLYAATAGTIGAPLINGSEWLLPTPWEALMLLSMGLCMSVGQHCITMGYGKGEASRMSVLYFLEVVYAAVFGLVVFDTFPDNMTIAGSVLIIGGAVLLATRKQS